jgi:hypothetical protein
LVKIDDAEEFSNPGNNDEWGVKETAGDEREEDFNIMVIGLFSSPM